MKNRLIEVVICIAIVVALLAVGKVFMKAWPDMTPQQKQAVIMSQ